MKRYTLYIIVAILGMLNIQPAEAQQKQDALYVFRNDGKFNAFYYADIDHIEYSKVDTLGKEQSDYVVQEIYALDTIVRIPISAIDSVAFVTPETVYKADMAATAKSDLWKHVIGSDSISTLLLSSSTPSTLIPKVGDKIATTQQTSLLPGGFFGKVASVNSGAEGITVKCDVLSMLDVFDQYVSKSVAVGGDASTRAEVGGAVDVELPSYHQSYQLDGLGYGFTDQFSISGSGKVEYNLTPFMNLRTFLSVGLLTGINFDMTMRLETRSSFEMSMKGTATGQFDIELVKRKVYIPDTPGLFLDVMAGIGTSVSLSGELSIKKANTSSGYAVVQYNESMFEYGPGMANLSYHNLGSESETKMLGSITLTAYPYYEVDLTFIDSKLDAVGVRLESGAKAEVTSEIKMEDLIMPVTYNNTMVYDELNRNGSVKIGPYSAGKLTAKLGKWSADKTIYEAERTWDFEGGLVPNFSAVNATLNNKTLETTIELKDRNVLFSCPVGAIVYDSKGNKIADKWYEKEYWKQNYKSFSLTIPDINLSGSLRVYPLTKLFGYELLASPYKEVAEEPWMKVTPESQNLGANGGTAKFSITDNVTYTVADDVEVDWEASVKFTGSKWFEHKWEGDDYVITAGANDTEETRKATITFTITCPSLNISMEKTVTVTQDPKSTEPGSEGDLTTLSGLVTKALQGEWELKYGNGAVETITFGTDGSYNVVMTSTDGYTQTGTYEINKYGIMSEGNPAGQLTETHTTSSTGNTVTKTYTFVVFPSASGGPDVLSYKNHEYTRKSSNFNWSAWFTFVSSSTRQGGEYFTEKSVHYPKAHRGELP